MFDNLNRMLVNIDKWMQSDTSNYGFIIVGSILIALVAGVAILYFARKVGTSDERTDLIRSKISNDAGMSLFIALMVYVACISSQIVYLQQLVAPFIAIGLVVGAIRSAIRYHRSVS